MEDFFFQLLFRKKTEQEMSSAATVLLQRKSYRFSASSRRLEATYEKRIEGDYELEMLMLDGFVTYALTLLNNF